MLRPFRTIHLSQAKLLPVFVPLGQSTKSSTLMILSFRPFRTIHQITKSSFFIPLSSSSLMSLTFRPFRTTQPIVLPHITVFSSLQDSPPNRPPSSPSFPCLFVPSGQPTKSSSLIQDNPPNRPSSSPCLFVPSGQSTKSPNRPSSSPCLVCRSQDTASATADLLNI